MWIVLSVLAGCAAPQPATVSCVCPPVAAAAAPSSPPAVAAAVVQHFDRAEQRAFDTVISPNATAAQISQIHAAEQRARRALAALGRTLPRRDPSRASFDQNALRAMNDQNARRAMNEAREAVTALEDALR